MPSRIAAKNRLDEIIGKGRVDLYKPIQIAEVLRRSRLETDIDVSKRETFQNPSIHWRNTITKRLLGKISTSSANYQHDIWNPRAMSPELLVVLDAENKRGQGSVERYIYLRFQERQETISEVIRFLDRINPEEFELGSLLQLFSRKKGIRRSIDKAYEIVAYALFETIIVALEATIKINVPHKNKGLLIEFSDLVESLFGITKDSEYMEIPAHLYRVGVTNAADRGLDMWANFGPAIQVKHLTLDKKLAQSIIDQVETDHIVIVCRDTDADIIKTIAGQISWGQRVRGIICESDLARWYKLCMQGNFSSLLATNLLDRLQAGFAAEFPQSLALQDFLAERDYLSTTVDDFWITDTDVQKSQDKDS